MQRAARPCTWAYGMVETNSLDAQPSNTLLYDAQRREVMLPCYLAVVMKSLRNLDEMEQTVDLSITLVVRIDYGAARGPVN